MMLVGAFTSRVLEQAAKGRRARCQVDLPKVSATEMKRSHELVAKWLLSGRMRRWAR